MSAAPSFNLADLFEAVADAVPDRTALIAGDGRLTYRRLDERAERFAHHLRESGLKPGEFVGIHAWNRAEWIEAMIGAYKARVVPININYRYVTAELRYLYENSGMVALVVERAFVPTAAELAPDFPALRHVVVLEDGTDPAAHPFPGEVRYEDALAAASPVRDSGPRSPDDLYGLYTGGTTGMPKCVLWRSEDIFFAALQAGRAGLPRITSPAELGAEAAAAEPLTTLGLAPMMHGGGQWSMWNTFYRGNTYILWTGHHFDPDAIMAVVAREKALSLAVVGDGMARPLADWYAENPGKDDVGSLKAVSNGGAPLSAAVRRQLETTAGLFVLDSFGASETGAAAREVGAPGGTTRFASSATTTVLDDALHPLAPGSGQVGRLAVTGHIPLGYHGHPGDDEKTRATFPVDADGRRWVLPGDFARIEEDGTLTLLGRGSATVNTGGEKVFPDEVEAALKTHPDVFDAVVVGVPDPRLGERVTALVVPRAGTTPDPDAIGAHTRTLIAGYKVPKRIHLVDAIERTAAGKVDLRAAKARAERLSAGR